MRVLVAAYTVLAIAAGARAAVQLATHAGEAPVQYALSAAAAAVYLTLAIALRQPDRRRRVALVAASAELAGVLAVGAAERLSATAWPDETVWSGFGAGYGWAPLVLPVAALVVLARRRVTVRPVPHIDLPEGVPGISSLFAYRAETAVPLRLLAETLLRGDSTLSRGERELIAAYVSNLNECAFCQASHSEFAARQLEGGMPLVEQVKRDPESAPIDDKLRALLAIAAKVQTDGRTVTDEDVAAARARGATDVEIHDTVLIAAAFCMYNRYVDGLAAWTPTDPEAYEEMGERIVEQGYLQPRPSAG